MFLNPHYTYCFLDFETTWLSHVRDDIIQVGLIIVDGSWSIKEYFSSFINPWYDIWALKTIVSYTTWITIEQIQSGISLDEFVHHMKSLLTAYSDIVFVWHNIWFDIRFLRKYCPLHHRWIVTNNLHTIDTLEWSKALIHYLPSHSLDIIYPKLVELRWSHHFQHILNQLWMNQLANHDALSDCVICLWLLYRWIAKIQTIMSSYPSIIPILDKSPFWWLDRGSLSHLPSKPLSDKIPLLDFPLKQPDSIIRDQTIDWSAINSKTQRYYGNMSIEQLIRKTTWIDKLIIATNLKNKLTIIKNKYKALWINSLSFIREQQQVSKEKLNRIYSKPHIDIYEAWFIIKYCSHKLQWLGILDLNTPGDYKIYNYIRNDELTSKGSILLTTHAGLYSLLDEGQYSDYTIIFLDKEWRYNTFLKYMTTPRDPVNFSRVIDNFVYEFTNNHQTILMNGRSSIGWIVDIFCWCLFMEIRDYLTNHDIKSNNLDQYELGVIANHTSFYKSNVLYQRIQSVIEPIEYDPHHPLRQFEWYEVIIAQYRKLISYMESIIATTIIASDYINYVFVVANKFVEYNELVHLFGSHKVLFFSNWNETRPSLTNQTYDQLSKKIKEITEHQISETIMTSTQSNQKIYILNNTPTKAKKLFEQLMSYSSIKEHWYKLLVENVTWGRGKCIELAKKYDKLILIGWYDMIMQCIQEKITFWEVIIYGHLWLLHEQIKTDLQYWMG